MMVHTALYASGIERQKSYFPDGECIVGGDQASCTISETKRKKRKKENNNSPLPLHSTSSQHLDFEFFLAFQSIMVNG